MAGLHEHVVELSVWAGMLAVYDSPFSYIVTTEPAEYNCCVTPVPLSTTLCCKLQPTSHNPCTVGSLNAHVDWNFLLWSLLNWWYYHFLCGQLCPAVGVLWETGISCMKRRMMLMMWSLFVLFLFITNKLHTMSIILLFILNSCACIEISTACSTHSPS